MSVLFIHGWASDASVWPAALRDQNAFFYNSAGTFPNYQHLTKAFMAFLQTSNPSVTLVGWSLGGMLALQLAAAHPEKIRKVVLISSTARFTTCENYTAGLSPAIVKNLCRKLQKNKWQTQLDFYQSMFSVREKDMAQRFLTQAAPSLQHLSAHTLVKGLDYLLSIDLRELLPQIKQPCYILHGTDDTICPVDSAFFLANNLKNSKLLVLKNTGHIPFYTRFQEVTDFCLQEEQKK